MPSGTGWVSCPTSESPWSGWQRLRLLGCRAPAALDVGASLLSAAAFATPSSPALVAHASTYHVLVGVHVSRDEPDAPQC